MSKNKCGHKAGPDCIICNDPADTEVTKHVAVVYQLMDQAPTLIAAQLVDTNAATSMFMEALGYTAHDFVPEPGVVNRLSKLVLIATNTAAQMVRLVDPREEIILKPQPGWREEHLLSARLLMAAANRDPDMVSDLLVAALAGDDAREQVVTLANLLYLQVTAAWKAREVAKAKGTVAT